MSRMLLTLFSFAISAQASAGILLDCSLPAGPTARAQVIKNNDGSLVLREFALNNSSHESSRALSQEEWASAKISLKLANDDDPQTATYTLSKDQGLWWVDYIPGGFNQPAAQADCR